MTSQNFEFLRPRRAVVADFGGLAESFAHSDPTGPLLNRRRILEEIVARIDAGCEVRASRRGTVRHATK